ncbi:MAG: lipoprotein [Candidatus Hamiltonella defensa (Ceratovacuna japonica)]
MFSAVSIKSLGGVLVMALLSGIWWHGYTQGVGRATERCAATLSQLRETFAIQEKQRAEQAAQTLQALQQRFTHQVKVAHQAEQHYLNRIAQLRDKTQHLTRRIDDVTQHWQDEKGQAHTVACVFTRGFVQHYNAALGLSDVDGSVPAAAAGGTGNTTRSAETPGERHPPSPVTQRDILANITDNGQQCQVWRAQVNGLLDYIEGLTP